MRVNADPFKDVKAIIQKLIERLLQEANTEATKKGFCDTEVSKAEQDRDFRLQEAKQLNVEIAALNAKTDELALELEALSESLMTLKTDLDEATKLRGIEKEA